MSGHLVISQPGKNNRTTGRQNFGLGLGSLSDLEIIFVAQFTVTQLIFRPVAVSPR